MGRLIPLLSVLLAGCGDTAINPSDTPPSPSSAPEIVYSGKSTPAVVTSSNAIMLAGDLMDQTGVVPIITDNTANTASQKAPPAGSISKMADSVRRAASSATAKILSRTGSVREEINIIYHGRVSGTATETGIINSDGTGRITYVYDEFDDAGGFIFHSGSITWEIDAFDASFNIETVYTTTYSLLNYQDSNRYFVFDGAVDSQITTGSNTVLAVVNATIDDLKASKQLKIESLFITDTYDDLFHPTTYSRTLGGRLYDSTEGFVNVHTAAPLLFGSYLQPFPDGGGPIFFTGANGAQFRVTPLSTTQAKIDVDPDGDGTFEPPLVFLWAAIAG